MPRPKKTSTTADMFRAARLFYKSKLSKKEIAAEMHTDIRSVTRLLKEAEEKEIVKIQIFETAESGIEQSLRSRFPHLERVLVAPSPQVTTPDDYDELYQRFGVLAADYFEELVVNHNGETPLNIGVTGGHHLLAFANAVPQRIRDNVKIQVTALVGRGRLDESAAYIEPNVVASILWSHCGSLPGHCEYATVSPYDPAETKSKTGLKVIAEELAKLKRNQAVRQVIEAMEELDVVFGGIGAGNPATAKPALRNRLTMTTILQRIIRPEDLRDAVGDFSYCPYDAKGRRKPEWRFFITAGHLSETYWGIEFYKRMVATPGKKVVAFSGGLPMLPAVQAGLKAEIFNVLIIDEYTGRQVAEES